MLVIKLRRVGKKNKPTYRVVAAERASTPTGKFIVDFGFYNPHTKEKNLNIELVLEWLNKGARPSNTVGKIFQALKIEHASIAVVSKNKKPKKEPATDQVLTGQPSKPETKLDE